MAVRCADAVTGTVSIAIANIAIASIPQPKSAVAGLVVIRTVHLLRKMGISSGIERLVDTAIPGQVVWKRT